MTAFIYLDITNKEFFEKVLSNFYSWDSKIVNDYEKINCFFKTKWWYSLVEFIENIWLYDNKYFEWNLFNYDEKKKEQNYEKVRKLLEYFRNKKISHSFSEDELFEKLISYFDKKILIDWVINSILKKHLENLVEKNIKLIWLKKWENIKNYNKEI